MQEAAPAIECMILFYINKKSVLQTKHFDEIVFLDEMTRHCKENGYQFCDIRNTWKGLVSRYLELKANGTVEDKEAWKYYEILDSCYEQSDFHNGVYPKFSEETVWYLIERFLKRKGIEETVKWNNTLSEIHKEFLQCGYLGITKQDIENKWKYLIWKYDEVNDDPEALNKLPYLQAVAGFLEKRDKYVVKMIFTKDLTEILIECFTKKKIKCVIHGYDSEQVLDEIQYDFRELGFDFSQQEIEEKWRKLTNVYWFLKAKGNHDSSWIYFNAMMDHFSNNYLYEFQKRGKNIHKKVDIKRPSLRQRSKSLDADVRTKHTIDDVIKTNLVVNIEQHDKRGLPPSPNWKPVVEKLSSEGKLCVKRANEANAKDSLKKIRTRSQSKEESKKKETSLENNKGIKTISTNDNNEVLQSVSQTKNSVSARKSSTHPCSPESKVCVINIDNNNLSDIDKINGNLMKNLPPVANQFSGDEFLPLKKRLRLRLADGHTDKHSDDTRDVEDLKCPASDIKPETECKRLTEEEMREILESAKGSTEKIPYSILNQPGQIIPIEGQPDNLLQAYNNNRSALTPVFLLVIKVDGVNEIGGDVRKDNDKKHDSVGKGESQQANNILNMAANMNNTNVEKVISYNKVPTVNDNEILKFLETIPSTRDEKNSAVSQQRPNPKSIPSALLVKGEGKAKNKNARMRPEDFKIKQNPVKTVNDAVTKTATEPLIPLSRKIPNFIKFVSRNMKPLVTEKHAENKPEENTHKTSEINSAADHKEVIPPLSISTSKIVDTNDCISGNGTLENDEFDSESVFSEAVGDDDLSKDNLLATVADFQEQNNRDFVDIKNLMKQENLLQRETNRLLRSMLGKI